METLTRDMTESIVESNEDAGRGGCQEIKRRR